MVGDSHWEIEFARIVERHPRTLAYLKNQALGFEVPYLAGTEARSYLPYFIVRLDDGLGADDPLMLVVEIKGERLIDDQVKAETMRSLFVPGVNNLGTFGRWDFIELTNIWTMGADFEREVAARIQGGNRLAYSSATVRDIVRHSVEHDWSIPEFQRGFVWKATQVRDLAESLWLNYPVGTLLVWDSGSGAETRSATDVRSPAMLSP